MRDALEMAAILFLSGAAAYLATLAAIDQEDDGGNGCPRRGCRRMPAGQGCNHQPQTDGSASGPFNEETEE